MTSFPKDVTPLLVEWSHGHQEALEHLIPLVYTELQRLAHAYLRREPANDTLQTTALVHETYLRLVHQKNVRWQDRAHFFGLAAQLMRQVLINHAHRRQAAKRDGAGYRLTIAEAAELSAGRDIELIALDEALSRLARLDAQKSRIVELRYFGGLTMDEMAEVLGVSPKTVQRAWRLRGLGYGASWRKGGRDDAGTLAAGRGTLSIRSGARRE